MNRTVISIKSLTNDWPTRPNSEPILKLTNHNSLEFEIDSSKINVSTHIYVYLYYINLHVFIFTYLKHDLLSLVNK